MIRVEITKTQWRTPSGNLAFFEPVPEEGVEHTKERQVLLVQEFEDLRIKPIVALLNRLQETPLCTCGHPTTKHEGGLGKCSNVRNDGPTYMSDRRCDCQRYESRGKAEFREYREESEATLAESKARTAAAVERQSELLDELARLTRSRDSLRRRSKKSGAKRR